MEVTGLSLVMHCTMADYFKIISECLLRQWKQNIKLFKYVLSFMKFDVLLQFEQRELLEILESYV